METRFLEELILKIHKLQSIMIDVATGKADSRDEDKRREYTKIYDDVSVTIELLQEDGITVWNPNQFQSLQSWYVYCSSELDDCKLRRQYIRNLYSDLIVFIEDSLQKRASESPVSQSLTNLAPDHLEFLLSEIEGLKSILRGVAGDRDINTEEASYIELYQKLLFSLRELQHIGIPLRNPNNFSSLWHWQNYWVCELDDYAARQEFVDNLYTSIVKPTQKALQRHQQRSTSIEEFINDLRRRFSDQLLEQSSISSVVKAGVIEQTSSTISIAPSGSTQFLESDSTQSINSHSSVASLSTEPMIDFAIITAIKTERLAILKSFEIDEEKGKGRICKEARTYWRKRVLLQNGKFYEIVVAQSLDMANVNAAILTKDVLHHWQPAAVLMVGIAATAKPQPHQQLGALVVGGEVYYYETGKITAEGKLPQPKEVPVDPTLLDRVQGLPDAFDFTILAERPDGTNTRPQFEVGVIASGDKVIADAAKRDEIAATNRKIMAIEMEGYGVIEAVRQNFEYIRCLVIRALCDYADSNKHDQWHSYAAAVAAGFTKHFLLDEPLAPRNPPTEAEHNSRSKVTA
jgi:nucleoside phosphorylase